MKSYPPTQPSLLSNRILRLASVLTLVSSSFTLSISAQNETVELPAMEIVADRAFVNSLGVSSEILMGDIETKLSLDEALRRLSSIDTFRSLDSFTAHPTTQGLRFRHTATNATSRALLLVDGVPQNDPFGGWIYWNKIPLESMHALEVFPIGTVPAWGNYSSGGAIHLTTRDPWNARTSYSVQGGSFNTVKGTLEHTAPVSDTTGISVEGRFFRTDGYEVVRPDQRGSVDQGSDSDYQFVKLKLVQRINDDWRWALTGQHYTEARINGTPLSPNSTESTDLSWTLSRESASGPDFNLVTFYQDIEFRNIFTSVSEDRNSELPVLDQYSVPAEAVGGQATWFWEGDGQVNFLAGGDFRQVEGSANELFRNLGSGFTRERQEGGEQSFLGAFVTLQTLPDENSSLEGTVRFDHWEQRQGFRREFNLENGAQTGDTQYPYRSGDVPSFNLKYTRNLDTNWSFGLLGFRGFRAPTLNELYRPFRVRNDITESNPQLGNELSTGGELSLYYKDEANSFQLSGFEYFLDDMVTNIFLHERPGFDSLCGFIPAGGSCNHRRNVEEGRVRGAEIAWQWDPGNDFVFLFNYTYSHAEFTKATSQTSIEGKAFPLSPKHKLSSQLAWHLDENLEFLTQMHYRSSHFDDALNTRLLGSAFQVNLGARYHVPGGPWTFQLQVDNVFDEAVTTAISGNGVYTQAAPRNVWFSLRHQH